MVVGFGFCRCSDLFILVLVVWFKGGENRSGSTKLKNKPVGFCSIILHFYSLVSFSEVTYSSFGVFLV